MTFQPRHFVIGATVVLSAAVTTMIVLANTRDPGVPPADARPLSEILQAIEDSGAEVITEVEFDGEHWEVEMRDGMGWITRFVDPVSGVEARREREEAEEELPPEGALPLSQIVETLSSADYGVIIEVDFENGFWEIAVRKDGTKTSL